MGVPKQLPKIEYKKILYTTDLSESGRYAFQHAASIAHQYEAGLTVYHVIEGGPELDKRLFGYVNEELWEEIKTRNLHEAKNILLSRKRDDVAVREHIEQVCKNFKNDLIHHAYVTYDIVIEMGDPVDRILSYVESGHYDLIVMGNKGYGPLEAAIMGDTVTRVLKRSKTPILVAQIPENPA